MSASRHSSCRFNLIKEYGELVSIRCRASREESVDRRNRPVSREKVFLLCFAILSPCFAQVEAATLPQVSKESINGISERPSALADKLNLPEAELTIEKKPLPLDFHQQSMSGVFSPAGPLPVQGKSVRQVGGEERGEEADSRTKYQKEKARKDVVALIHFLIGWLIGMIAAFFIVPILIEKGILK